MNAEKFTELKQDIDEMSDRKIRLEERFKTKTKDLEKLLKEINEKGYDPKKLSEIRKEKEEQLEKLLGELETEVNGTKEKLNSIEV